MNKKKCKICKRPLTGNEKVCPECKNKYGTGMVVGVGIISATIVKYRKPLVNALKQIPKFIRK